jgi:hypothetical protein
MKTNTSAVKVNSIVRATKRIVDEVEVQIGKFRNEVFAIPQDIGRVCGVEYEGKSVVLTVAFENAPHATTCVLGDECELRPELAFVG